MGENKRSFVSSLATALLMYSREKVVDITLSEDETTAIIRFTSGTTKNVNVAFDSCAAIMSDIARALLRGEEL